MRKIILISFWVLLIACDSEKEDDLNIIGTVVNTTSCSGGPEQVFIIKLKDEESIMTATLPKEFQIPNLEIKFKTKEPTIFVYCTTDKIYPNQLDVYDVSLLLD